MVGRCGCGFSGACVVVGFLTLFFPGVLSAMEFTASVAAEAQLFLHDPQFAGQRSQAASLAANAEFYHDFGDGSSVIVAPFARIDSADSKRSHVDLRECVYLQVGTNWELRVGLGKVFWGACEFVHLVDIINQTDLVESLDGDEKLGQPMIHLALIRDWGVTDIFLLPYFRERTYAGRHGRLRGPLLVDVDHPLYESGSEETHQDLALRYSRTVGAVDLGLAWFRGTSREPYLLAGLDNRGRPVLVPYYVQISQLSFDIQGVAGPWLLKAEALYRTGYGRSFAATTFGVEYTSVGIFDSACDLGLIGEYVFDDRQQDLVGLFDNDVMVGLRFAFNDAADSAILMGFVQDLDQSSRLLTLEASRRLSDLVRLNVEAAWFMAGAGGGVDNALADDDFIKIELVVYF